VTETRVPLASLTGFAHSEDSFGATDSETLATLIGSSSDVALVVDSDGIVRDVSFGSADLAKDAYRGWIGKPWTDTVTVESRPKIEELLRDTNAESASRWRQVNCPAASGPDVPIRFSAIRANANRQLIVIGRDLRAMAALQQRLAEAQQAMEREYARIRGAEKRYRLLFQLASEAVLIVDASSQRIEEANPSAAKWIGKDPKKLVGITIGELFEDSDKSVLQSFFAALRVAPRVDNVHVKLAAAQQSLLLSGALFRQENSAHFLLLFARLGAQSDAPSAEQTALLKVIDLLPEALVVTDANHRIVTANSAFLDMIQAATLEQARGEPIERWVGRPSVDVDLIFTNLRTHGFIRHFSTVLRGLLGSVEEIELAAVSVPGGSAPSIGFSIRAAGWRGTRDQLGGRELPRTVEQFAPLVGRVPLKNLVRETTDLIERLCIEAALEMTRDNRASAADLLGLSRQGLYAKLRRYGLGDLDNNEHPAN
jgi:transcriptional regulator PpsR